MLQWLTRIFRCAAKWIITMYILFNQQPSIAQTPNKFNEVRHLKTETGLEFGLWGGNGEVSPAPILFILSNTIDGTIGSEYFRQCGTKLAKQYGWLCVSLDLPYHGKFQNKNLPKELDGWANAVQRGENFVLENNLRMQEILNFLIRKKYGDPKNIAVCGTSRGGYLALQFAAFEKRVKSAAVFSPVTDLFALQEFKDIKKISSLSPFFLDNQVNELSKKRIWMVIGNNDQRVGTDQAIQLARKISSKVSTEQGKDKGEIELNVMFELKGHTTPEGAKNRAFEWLLNDFRALLPDGKIYYPMLGPEPDIYEPMVESFRFQPHSKKDIILLGNSITFWGDWQQLTGLSYIKNRGIPGDNTFGVIKRLDEVIDRKPKKIFILIGINDLSANIPDSIILKNYKIIIDKINVGSPSTKIYFQTILPINDIHNKKSNIFTKHENIRKINTSLKQLAFNSKKMVVIDLYGLFADDSGYLKKEYTWDGIHLNMNGYNKWATILKNGKYLKLEK
ncbi:MAG: alpha/beta fold hydrolase [Ginsengibacter sp.]